MAVIGGGITGLAAALRLVDLDPSLEVTLLEAGPRLGGVLETIERDGFLVERSADSFIANVPWAADLCRRVGLADDIIETDELRRQALVVRKGKLHRVPAGFHLMAPARLGPVLATPLLSPWGKLRLLAEQFVARRRATEDESLGDFVRRRFGNEVFERLVQPLIAGIYTADPEKLSIAATMPRFVEMEQRYGSLIRAARLEATSDNAGVRTDSSGARYNLFISLRRGMESLVAAIAERLPAGAVRLNTPVERIERNAGGEWTLHLAAAQSREAATVQCNAVIVALPAYRAASLVSAIDAKLAAELDRISYAGTAIACLAYRRDQIAAPLNGFGFVVPAIERRQILAAGYASNKFPGRAPEGSVLIRAFIGGACQAELLELPDEQLTAIANRELASLLGIRGEPFWIELARWPRSMPQYHVGHCELVARIEGLAAKHRGLALAGNAYHGVGVPNCIHSGESAGHATVSHLRATVS